jgi:putative transposase
MAFFNPEASLIIRRGKLPHWRQEGVIYFVTFHLADSLPRAKLEWLRREKELWLALPSSIPANQDGFAYTGR